MKFRILILLSLTSAATCANQKNTGNDLAFLATYQTPGVIIKNLKGKADTPRKHFVLATAYRDSQNYKAAILHYSNSCFSSYRNTSLRLFPHPVYRHVSGFHFKSPYYDDALLEIAILFYKYREYKYVLKFLQRIDDENTGLYREARELEIKTLIRLKKYREALKSLNSALDEFNSDSVKSRFYIRRASIYEKKGNYSEAKTDYLWILNNHPSSWQEGVASKRILHLYNLTHFSLSKKEHHLLARGLFNSGKFRDAAALLTAVERSGSLKDAELFLKALARAKKFNTADNYLKKIRKNDSVLDSVRLAYADELWKMGRETRAYRQYRILQKSKSEKIGELAHYRSGKYLEDRRKPAFIQHFLTMIRINPASIYAGEALWLIGRDQLRNNRNTPAIRYFEESLLKAPEGKNSDQCRFWLYRLYRKNRNQQKAYYHIIKLINKNPDSTYTWRLIPKVAAAISYERLQNSFKNAVSRNESDKAVFFHVLLTSREKNQKKRNKRLQNLPGNLLAPYKNLDEIIFDNNRIPSKRTDELKLYFGSAYRKGIKRTIAVLKAGKEKPENIYASICRYARSSGNHFYSIYNLQELYKSLHLKENIFLQTARLNHMLLPRPFLSFVALNSKKYAITKNKIYAVIKAESLFNHQAVSPAGAEGFMQLMPATARGIARQLKIQNYSLKDPSISIVMGAQYISWLNRYFKGNFDFIVAGYNAGPGNVNKWKKRKIYKDMDYFSEFVPFDETRYYIFRTNKYLQQYNILYTR